MTPNTRTPHLTHANSQLLHQQAGNADLFVYQQQQIRWLSFDGKAVQSAMHTDHPEKLVLPYLQAMTAGLPIAGRHAQILNLGFGGGALVRFIHHYLADMQVTSVEQNGRVVELARRFFAINNDYPVFIENADTFLQHQADRYQLLLVDLPIQTLLQEQFLNRCRERMHSDGALVANLFYRQAEALPTALAKMRPLFNNIQLLDVPDSPNLIVVAGNNIDLQAHCIQQRANHLTRTTGLPVNNYLKQMIAVPEPPEGRYNHSAGY